MSDVRFNNWKHQSGTGGVTQDSSGNVGIGSTLPTAMLDVEHIKTGIITATTVSATTVNVGGVLTYEDVTNVDSVGVVTAREGIRVGAGKSIGSDSGTVTYYGDGSNLSGISAGEFFGNATSGAYFATCFVTF